MVKRAFPNLGLMGGYAVGEDGWGDEQNANLMKLSMLVQATVKSFVDTLPTTPAPAQGDIYVLKSDGSINYYDDSAWHSYAPVVGWLIFNQDDSTRYEYVGGKWTELTSGSSGSAPAGHRYWRVSVLSTNGDDLCSINEIEFHETVGGPDLTSPSMSGSAAFSSSLYAGDSYPLSGAFDNTDGDPHICVLNNTTPRFIGWDFGTPKNIVEMALRSRGGYGQQTPKSWNVEWSDDKTAWTTAWTVNNQTAWNSNETRTFADPDPETGGGSTGASLPAGGTKGQVLTKKSATDGDAEWKTPVAGGSAGGGSAGLAGLFDKVAIARTSSKTDNFTGGSKVDQVIAQGDLTALLLDIYATGAQGPSSPVQGKPVVVPVGKVAFLIYAHKADSCYNDPTYYKHWVRNQTTGVDYNLGNNVIHRSGWVTPDNANNTTTYPVKVGVAGDTLLACASSAGDGNSRLVSGFAVIAFADATTGIFDPGAGTGGGGGSSGLFKPPLAANFPIVFKGSSTVFSLTDDPVNGLVVRTDHNADNDQPRGFMKAIPNPAQSWELIAHVNAKGAIFDGYSQFDIHLGRDDSNHVISWGIDCRRYLGWNYFEKPSGYGGAQVFFPTNDSEFWVKITHDAAAGMIYWAGSPDGTNWATIFSKPNTDRFGSVPNQVGPGFVVHNGRGNDLLMLVDYWQESGPGFGL